MIYLILLNYFLWLKINMSNDKNNIDINIEKIYILSIGNSNKRKSGLIINQISNKKKHLFYQKFPFSINTKIKNKNGIDITSLEYYNKNKIIYLFGNNFFENNKQKCRLIYNNKEIQLKLFIIDKNSRNKGIIKIKLRLMSFLTDISGMFYNCISLKSIANFADYNINKISDIDSIFFGCTYLSSLPDISNWSINNIKFLNELFYGCSSLKSLPDISNWNTNNVKFLNEIFYGCSSLKSLPDISKWNINNVEEMNGLFYGCKSLKSLPDISKWKTDNVNNMSELP